MRATKARIPERINRAVKKTPEGILPFDDGNDYPQWCIDLVNSSGMASYCVDLWSRFIEGQGAKDLVFYTAEINREGLTVDELLRWLCKDYAYHGGFALHVNYNALYKITEVRYIPFRDVRLIHPDSEEHQGKYAVYNDWGRRLKKTISVENIQFIDKFTLDPARIEAQVAAVKGWENYKGQLLWFSSNGKDYPLAPYDSVSEDIETDSRIKNHRRKKSRGGFNADYFYFHAGKFETDLEREEFMDTIEDNQGDDAAGNLILIEYDRPEEKGELQPIPKADEKNNFYTVNEVAVQDNIRKRFGFTLPLVGGSIQGMGISQAITESSNLMNGLTSRERRKMEETFKKVFSNFKTSICPSNDYSIIKLQLTEADIPTANGGEKSSSSQLKSLVGSVDAILNLQKSVGQGLTLKSSAIKILKELYEFDEITAAEIVGDPIKISPQTDAPVTTPAA